MVVEMLANASWMIAVVIAIISAQPCPLSVRRFAAMTLLVLAVPGGPGGDSIFN